MRTRRACAGAMCVVAFALSACGSGSDGDAVATPEPSSAAGLEVENTVDGSSVTTSIATADSTTTTTSASGEVDLDPDRSPPTTETEGLASGADAPEVADELTCWRVEDFGEESLDRWSVVNDGVMGGLSEGELTYTGGVVTFEGVIDTNGGGFSMIRTNIFRNGATLADSLDGAEFLQIRTRSANGRAYELTVQDATTNPGVMYFTDIAVTADSAWEEPLVPLTSFDARTFGTDQPTFPEFDLDQISTFGVILADGFDGPFSIAIDRIDACART